MELEHDVLGKIYCLSLKGLVNEKLRCGGHIDSVLLSENMAFETRMNDTSNSSDEDLYLQFS